MDINLELILVAGGLITGTVWLLDVLWLKKKRLAAVSDQAIDEYSKKEFTEPMWVDLSKSFFPVFIVVLLLRGFVFEPFRIPSSSMLPTLEEQDLILVSKFSYGLRLPLIHSKFLDNDEPERGDVIVFRYPKDPSINYIKRVVGVPGDEVVYINKQLYINKHLYKKTSEGVYEPGPGGPIPEVAIRYTENTGERTYDVLLTEGRTSGDWSTHVPDGKYLVLGDNRDNSNDSRYWGFVPEENLVGRASYIWMNLNITSWPDKLSRIGIAIND